MRDSSRIEMKSQHGLLSHVLCKSARWSVAKRTKSEVIASTNSKNFLLLVLGALEIEILNVANL